MAKQNEPVKLWQFTIGLILLIGSAVGATHNAHLDLVREIHKVEISAKMYTESHIAPLNKRVEEIMARQIQIMTKMGISPLNVANNVHNNN